MLLQGELCGRPFFCEMSASKLDPRDQQKERAPPALSITRLHDDDMHRGRPFYHDLRGRHSGPEKAVITKGVFSLEESLEFLKPL